MTAPDPLAAIAGLRHCVQAGDYAGAALRVSQPAALDAIASLAVYAAEQRAEADRARREAAAARLGEAERARVQALIGPLLDEVIGVLAEALAEHDRERRSLAAPVTSGRTEPGKAAAA